MHIFSSDFTLTLEKDKERQKGREIIILGCYIHAGKVDKVWFSYENEYNTSTNADCSGVRIFA